MIRAVTWLVFTLATVSIGTAQSVNVASIKMADGAFVTGTISGRIAYWRGFGTGGGLIAGSDIERIDEKGIQFKTGSNVVETIVLLSERYTMAKNPPHALILQNVLAKDPKTPGKPFGVQFEAPCSSFGDSSCERIQIGVNAVIGTRTDARIDAEKLLGEFRLHEGGGGILPVLTVTGADGKPARVDVAKIVAFEKAGK